jgi:hypothetical protein
MPGIFLGRFAAGARTDEAELAVGRSTGARRALQHAAVLKIKRLWRWLASGESPVLAL